MLRIVGSIIAGAIAAFAAVWLVELAGHLLFPLPGALDPRHPEALPSYPLVAKLIVVFAWFLGPPAGAWVARGFGGPRWASWVIVLLVACGSVFNIIMVPYPAWMQIAAVGAPLLGGLAAAHGFAWTSRTGSG